MDPVFAFFLACVQFVEAHPHVLMFCWLMFTASVSFAQDKIKAHSPKVWEAMQTSGLDLLGFLRLIWPIVKSFLIKRAAGVKAIAGMLVIALFLSGCGMSRAQIRDDVRQYGVPAAQITGAVCERIAAATQEEWVDFACTVVQGIGSVLGNLDSSGHVAVDQPDGPPVVVTVRVRAEEADAFEAQHKQ